jgi:drug/metabolite transporter (DMT)-like permease
MNHLVIGIIKFPASRQSGASRRNIAVKRIIVWGLLVATGGALGMAMPLGKLAVAHGMAPLSFVLFPALAAGLLLATLAALRFGPPARQARLLAFGLVSGFLGNALPNTMTAWLSAQAGASFAGLAYTLPPVFTLMLMLLFRLEKPQGMRLLAVALGLAGAFWLVSTRVSGGTLALAGALALLAIPAAIGAGNVYRARFMPRDVPALWLGAALSLGAFTFLLPVWVWGPMGLSAVSLAGLPYLAVQTFSAATGAVLFFELQSRAEPVTMSFVGYAIALTAVLAGALVLDETLPAQLLPAAALIVAGFWLIQRQPAQPLSTP